MKRTRKFGIGAVIIIIGAALLGYYLIHTYKKSDSPMEPTYCKCYCSDKCGPRDNTKPTDAPFVDPETGICFCQQRDKDNFVKNGCDSKENAPFVNCCGK